MLHSPGSPIRRHLAGVGAFSSPAGFFIDRIVARVSVFPKQMLQEFRRLLVSCARAGGRVHVHQPLGGFQGQASDIVIQAEEMLQTKRRIIGLYAKHCGRTYEEVERTLDRDHFMNAEGAREWGLIDRVLSSRSEAELMLGGPYRP